MKRIQQPKPTGGGHLLAPQADGKSSSHHLPPKFSLANLSKSHCLSVCTTEQKAAFADRIHELSQLTWQAIMQAPRGGQGSETIARTSIKPSIPKCITDDVNILAFRCIGKAPMVGYKIHDTFYVVWIDRDFTVYDH